jgi:hypothetical protein
MGSSFIKARLRMKPVLRFLTISLLVLLFSCSSRDAYDPAAYFTEKSREQFLLRILPYFAKLPKGYTPDRRFEPSLVSFYRNEVRSCELQWYFQGPDSLRWFMVTRPAPSLFGKRMAIAGRLKQNARGEITSYEEAFWTFKMSPEELGRKGRILFDAYVKGKSLEAWLPGKQAEEWIEFPDGNYFYSKDTHTWTLK